MKKRTFKEILEVSADIPSDMLYGGSHVTIKGRGEAIVYGCKSILFYSEERIELEMHSFILVLTGNNLFCISFCEGQIVIKGRISGVTYSDEEAK